MENDKKKVLKSRTLYSSKEELVHLRQQVLALKEEKKPNFNDETIEMILTSSTPRILEQIEAYLTRIIAYKSTDEVNGNSRFTKEQIKVLTEPISDFLRKSADVSIKYSKLSKVVGIVQNMKRGTLVRVYNAIGVNKEELDSMYGEPIYDQLEQTLNKYGLSLSMELVSEEKSELLKRAR